VAIVHLDGQIVDGENDLPGVLVSGPTVKEIHELEADENIRAVVVRINSPGGSATASESIRTALAKLARTKPVIVSMGEMAASGGYWIACLGRPIYAEPGTITGSIGVFSLKLSVGGFLKKIGLKVEHVTLDESAAAMSFDREWTPPEQERMQELVGDIYARFTRLVAESRKLKSEQVSAIAGGRVWSGAQAIKLGLVDHSGGLDDAVVAAAREAKLDPGYDIIHRPRKKNFMEVFDLFGGMEGGMKSLLPATTRAWLQESGFHLAIPLNLLRESLTAQPPRAWLMVPDEMVIR
jgi:protease-4